MKITIDTKEDSHDEIRRLITLLTSLMNNEVDSPGESGLSNDPKPIIGEGVFGMFSNNNEENAPASKPETASGSEVTGVFSDSKETAADVPEPNVVENVKKDDETRVVPY